MKIKGFTLLELLIVLAIIAVLIAVAVPFFINAKKSAWQTVVKSDVKHAVEAVFIFYGEYNTFPTEMNPNPCGINFSSCVFIKNLNSEKFVKTKGVIIEYSFLTNCPSGTNNQGKEGFVIKGSHYKLPNYLFRFDSCQERFY